MTNPEQLTRWLLDHYDQHGRRLPWRGERDLYRLWVSEVMLQQTGVVTVIPYYHRFLARFATLPALAAAPLEAVLEQWQGLGYYARARHLHAAAQQAAALGGLPETAAGLQQLPGIGRSTAHAILAIGRDQPLPILDGNVKRVLCRLLALPNPPDRPATQALLWHTAALLTPADRPGDYAQAIMDLGATLCSRTRPRCLDCPWLTACQGHALGAPDHFPVAKAKKAKPRRQQTALVVLGEGGRVLLGQRPAKGLLGGLWQPPSTDQDLADLARRLGLDPLAAAYRGQVEHTFTHFHLSVAVHAVSGPAAHPGEFRWFDRAELARLPLATLHRKVLALGIAP